jgi:hypothetical protein
VNEAAKQSRKGVVISLTIGDVEVTAITLSPLQDCQRRFAMGAVPKSAGAELKRKIKRGSPAFSPPNPTDASVQS